MLKAVLKPKTLALPTVALKSVTSKSGLGVYASSDKLFKGAVFGRDSSEVAEDLMLIKPKLVKQIILTMVRSQGQKKNRQSQEEPGKIVHEYRQLIVDGRAISQEILDIYNLLASKWGSDDEDMAHYGAIDATPLFLRVVNDYCQKYGDSLLQETMHCRDGQDRTVSQSVQLAANWLVKQLKKSKSGFLEFTCDAEVGIANQVWKDSNEVYVHQNGERINATKPISSIEVQAQVYDGLLAAATLIPNQAAQYQKLAKELRSKVLNTLWLEETQYFALGTDFDAKGKLRLITTPTANPAALLDSGLFDDLPKAQRQKFVSGIVRRIMAHDFLTSAGIRSRSLLAAHVTDYWDYQGSFVCWPKETYDIAKGLKRQGFNALARQLENRLINVVLKHRQYPEFVYVDGWDRVLDSTPATQTYANVTVVTSTNNPEKVQAWTVSAILAITSERISSKLRLVKLKPASNWQTELEAEILQNIPKIKRHLNPLTLQARYPSNKYRLQKYDGSK